MIDDIECSQCYTDISEVTKLTTTLKTIYYETMHTCLFNLFSCLFQR